MGSRYFVSGIFRDGKGVGSIRDLKQKDCLCPTLCNEGDGSSIRTGVMSLSVRSRERSKTIPKIEFQLKKKTD